MRLFNCPRLRKQMIAALVVVGALPVAFAGVAGAASKSISATSCTGTLGAVTIAGDLDAGPGCTLNGTTVTGNVTVHAGGSLQANSAVIEGSLNAQGATLVNVLYGSIGGGVQVTDSIPCIVIGPLSVNGSVVIDNNSGDGDQTCGASEVGLNAGSVSGAVEIDNNNITSAQFTVLAFEPASPVTGNPGYVSGKVTIDGNALTSTNPNSEASIQVNGSEPGNTSAPEVGADLDISQNTINGNSQFNAVDVQSINVAGTVKLQNNVVSGSNSEDFTAIIGVNAGGNLLFQHNVAEGLEGAYLVANVIDGNAVAGNINAAANSPSPQSVGDLSTAKNFNGQSKTIPVLNF